MLVNFSRLVTRKVFICQNCWYKIKQKRCRLRYCYSERFLYSTFKNSVLSKRELCFHKTDNRYFSNNIDVKELINENETVVTDYVNSVMESFSATGELGKVIVSGISSAKINKITPLLSSRIILCENLKNLDELISGPDQSKDKEFQKLIETEQSDYKKQIQILDYELINFLIPEEPHDTVDDLVIEVKHGVGGQEAMLFAKDLFQMYCQYIDYKGWKYEIADLSGSDIGGIRYATIMVYGKSAFKTLWYESGVHRVQRIPETEKGGRMHTSTITVAILPQPSEIEVVINNKDLKIEAKKASGAGGQHVNTTSSAIRVTHLPTGTAVECQQHRTQHMNKEIALQRLRAILYKRQLDEQLLNTRTSRKLQVGSSARSDKIRTYNFNQDRITDHRIGLSLFNTNLFMEGSELFDKMLSLLKEESNRERLKEFISNIKNNS